MHPGSAGRQCGANPGMPPLRGCLHVGLYRIGPHPTISVITTIVKTYIESPEPASNLADEQFLQRRSWMGEFRARMAGNSDTGAVSLLVVILIAQSRCLLKPRPPARPRCS